MDVATAGILGVAIGSALGIVSNTLPQFFQNSRAKSQQAHELKRDQYAKRHEFRLLEYKERRDACADLLDAAHHFAVAAGSRYEALTAFNKARSIETNARLSAEAEAFAQHNQLGAENSLRGLHILSTDRDAEQVIKLYRTLPMAALLDDPMNKEVKQVWRKGVTQLQEAIYVYLDSLRLRLFDAGDADKDKDNDDL